MILCLTEKPSVARDIASILGASVKRDGFFEGEKYCVTWTYGHLCTLKEPADYTPLWKKWSLAALPMIPPTFGIKIIDQPSIKKQFNTIKTLISKADLVINCGDAGQEGELIQRWVMQKASCKCPVMRLWISSLTDEAIRQGFADLKPQVDFDNLYYAGVSRAVGDWVLGLNATRLYSLKYSEPGKVLSIGRVQTPTLAIVVNRQLEIDNFMPSDYWEVKTIYRDTQFSLEQKKFDTEVAASEVVDKLHENQLTITDVQKKKNKESAPRLFDLTSLQVECNKKFGWSADESLKLIQSLYEKKLTTYPRVDTTYLSEDIYPKVPEILRQMIPYESIIAPILSSRITKSKKVFDNSKVTDHHAIIPTGQLPRSLDTNEKKMYHLIARRFIAVFYPDCIYDSTTVNAMVGEFKFKATGKVIVEQGWRAIYNQSQKDDSQSDDDATNQILPDFVVGESGPHQPSLIKKTTQPPKFYTEGTLLRAMEGAGKLVDDDDLRDAMKENGIGRPSTRAAIIETLFKRGYMVRQGKSIRATQAGIELIGLIKEELIKSAKLTGLWENKLRRIERGDYSSKAFIGELTQLIGSIVTNVLSDNENHKINIVDVNSKEKKSKSSKLKKNSTSTSTTKRITIKDFNQIKCPKCSQGYILKGKTAFGCSRYKEGCDFRINFNEFKLAPTPAKLNSYIKKRYAK